MTGLESAAEAALRIRINLINVWVCPHPRATCIRCGDIMVTAARQCIRTRGVDAEVYQAPSKVCIAIRVGYVGFVGPLVSHSGERVYGIPL